MEFKMFDWGPIEREMERRCIQEEKDRVAEEQRKAEAELNEAISAMKTYVKRTKMPERKGFDMIHQDLMSMIRLSEESIPEGLILAFAYGRAKGYRMAKAEARRART